MAAPFLELNGDVVSVASLALPRARALAELVGGGNLPFVNLVECRRVNGDVISEIVVIDVDVERPQTPVYDIRRKERVSVGFSATDSAYPSVLSLRSDFPEVPHLNLTGSEYPKSLCLYDRPWSEIALRWTPVSLVERVRFWMAQTARGSLHQTDQPLEPLLADSGMRIILPVDVLTDLGSDNPVRLELRLAKPTEDCRTLVANRPKGEKEKKEAPKYVATTFAAKPQTHGIIRRSPATLSELHDFLLAGGIDLVESLRRRLRNWNESRLLDASLVLIVVFPLARVQDSEAERWDFWTFLTVKTVREVGVAIGLWEVTNDQVGILLNANNQLRGQDVPIDTAAPFLEFSRSRAASANGAKPDPCRAVAVGAGALGSQVVVTLARSGFGSWTIVDEDDLLPHNLARHALNGFYVGHSKAVSLAFELDMLYREGEEARAIVADVLAPGGLEKMLADEYIGADLILDIAASVPVARHLAQVPSPARRVSVFLNPQGTDLVVLAEDLSRKMTLDTLEVQYYRAAATDTRMSGHLAANPGRLRYGRSCRDITTSMPTHLVTLHSAAASECVRRIKTTNEASIRVWRYDAASMGVTPIQIPPTPMIRQEIFGWTLLLDQTLLQRLAELRQMKLPNETGGVLIGVYDLQRRVIYVVDTIPSPPDSAEWPTLYIRGSDGLLSRVQELSAKSGGQLEYVGEWHSHPDGCPTLPSGDDLQVFSWLTEHLSLAGLPALMAIVGEGASSSWYLGEMLATGGWGVEV